MTKIFIGGFPLDADELTIVQLFAPHGDVSTIKIVRDRATKICKGYAFIEMNELSEALDAVNALNGSEFAGRELQVSIVEEKPAAPVNRYSRNTGPRDNAMKPKRPRRPLN